MYNKARYEKSKNTMKIGNKVLLKGEVIKIVEDGKRMNYLICFEHKNKKTTRTIQYWFSEVFLTKVVEKPSHMPVPIQTSARFRPCPATWDRKEEDACIEISKNADKRHSRAFLESRIRFGGIGELK